jgi:hypothetical protein
MKIAPGGTAVALIMETVSPSETSISMYQTTQCYIPEYSHRIKAFKWQRHRKFCQTSVYSLPVQRFRISSCRVLPLPLQGSELESVSNKELSRADTAMGDITPQFLFPPCQRTSPPPCKLVLHPLYVAVKLKKWNYFNCHVRIKVLWMILTVTIKVW